MAEGTQDLTEAIQQSQAVAVAAAELNGQHLMTSPVLMEKKLCWEWSEAERSEPAGLQNLMNRLILQRH